MLSALCPWEAPPSGISQASPKARHHHPEQISEALTNSPTRSVKESRSLTCAKCRLSPLCPWKDLLMMRIKESAQFKMYRLQRKLIIFSRARAFYCKEYCIDKKVCLQTKNVGTKKKSRMENEKKNKLQMCCGGIETGQIDHLSQYHDTRGKHLNS